MPACKKNSHHRLCDVMHSPHTNAQRSRAHNLASTTLAEVLANEHDRVVIHWVFAITDGAGKTRTIDELAVQTWRDEKIFSEQFYYDPAQLKT